MRLLLDFIRKHTSGQSCGVYSVCSAHEIAIEAALIHAKRMEAPLALLEATSNQVNQDGGYTGMQPADYCNFVLGVADRVGFPRSRVALGGDHLGPHPWRRLPAAQAMAKAAEMVSRYVEAGFRKIHLDCSMSCSDDSGQLPDETIARRSASLCSAAEQTWARVGGEAPVYVIGTEVPVPGGAQEALQELAVTTPEAARATIRKHREVFLEAGLGAGWSRVVAAVVQPGVEFDHRTVLAYNPVKAEALSKVAAEYPGMVFEAHSTDYQTPEALAQLVRDHFAVLKVGPAVTFALREALWGLDAIEREWIGEANASRLRGITIQRMKAEPEHWSQYYKAGTSLDFDLQYSLSDRIRYYWNQPDVVAAQSLLFMNLANNPPPDALVSQYLPTVFRRGRRGRHGWEPRILVIEKICSVLDEYSLACGFARSAAS